MFQFITRRPLWANILFALVLLFVLLFILFSSLNWVTNHGKILKIPQVIGKSITAAQNELSNQGFSVVIQDSVYADSLPLSSVVKQFPEPDAEVKINRTVYLTVNRSSAPLVQMPKLIGQSLRSAEVLLRQTGLKLGDTTFIPDFAKNSIIKQFYKGDEIAAGTKIPVGAKIDLLIAKGIAEVDMAVPNLFGMTYGDAKELIESHGLSFGVKLFDNGVRDSLNAYVYWQSPSRLTEDGNVNRIHQGQLMDIKCSAEKRTEKTEDISEPSIKSE